MAGQDLIGECNDQGLTEQEFLFLFCSRCHNSDCQRADWAGTRWEARMSTQVSRLLDNPRFADLRDPKHSIIHALDWGDRRREALTVHISEGLGDWSIPVVDDVQLAAKGSPTASAVEQAIGMLSAKAPEPTPPAPAPNPVALLLVPLG